MSPGDFLFSAFSSSDAKCFGFSVGKVTSSAVRGSVVVFAAETYLSGNREVAKTAQNLGWDGLLVDRTWLGGGPGLRFLFPIPSLRMDALVRSCETPSPPSEVIFSLVWTSLSSLERCHADQSHKRSCCCYSAASPPVPGVRRTVRRRGVGGEKGHLSLNLLLHVPVPFEGFRCPAARLV